LKIPAFVLVLVLVLFVAQSVLMPKYITEAVDGRLVAEYYSSAKNHDVVFVGDCEIYENISPITLWKEYGISAYFRGSPQQLIWHSYYMMEDTLRYEKPKAFVFNVLSMKYGEPQNEAYNRLALDGMEWSKSKLDAINASMTEEETFLSYVFPILRYHSRFDKLTSEDFRYLFTVKDNTFNGYQMNKGILPVGTLPTVRRLANYQFGEICYEYLDKMRVLCEEKGVELILVKAPSLQPHWYEQYNDQMVEYAARHGLKFYNFVDVAEEIGIDYQTDTYDAGLHLNLAGATKMSQYFARILAEEHGIHDRRNDPEISELYDEKLRQYDAEANKESE
jgi:hypothetical protein